MFDHDHLIPTAKKRTICSMVYDKRCSLSDIKEALLGCRVLCKNCHRIHTSMQHEAGIIISVRVYRKRAKVTE